MLISRLGEIKNLAMIKFKNMISDKSYSNIPLYFCLFCSILNMAQYVWIQCASTSCKSHIFVSSIVLNILFCHPKELNLLLNLCQSFLGAGNLSDRLESKKKSFAFGYWEKVALLVHISTIPRKDTEIKTHIEILQQKAKCLVCKY